MGNTLWEGFDWQGASGLIEWWRCQPGFCRNLANFTMQFMLEEGLAIILFVKLVWMCHIERTGFNKQNRTTWGYLRSPNAILTQYDNTVWAGIEQYEVRMSGCVCGTVSASRLLFLSGSVSLALIPLGKLVPFWSQHAGRWMNEHQDVNYNL